MKVKLRIEHLGSHVHVWTYVGQEHAYAGRMSFRAGREWSDVRSWLLEPFHTVSLEVEETTSSAPCASAVCNREEV